MTDLVSTLYPLGIRTRESFVRDTCHVQPVVSLRKLPTSGISEGCVRLRPYRGRTHCFYRTVPAEQICIHHTWNGRLAISAESRCARAMATGGSGCEVLKSPRGGFEHGPHLTSDFRPLAFIPHYCAAELAYVGGPHHRQLRVGARKRMRSRRTLGNGSRTQCEEMPQLHCRLGSCKSRNSR